MSELRATIESAVPGRACLKGRPLPEYVGQTRMFAAARADRDTAHADRNCPAFVRGPVLVLPASYVDRDDGLERCTRCTTALPRGGGR
jgi:hypothetical protein